MKHQYAAHGDSMPGALTEHGATCQQLRVVPEAIFIQPEILGQDDVSKAATRRADGKRASSRVSRKTTRKPRPADE